MECPPALRLIRFPEMTSQEVEDIKRHFTVVAEGIEKKVQLVAEAIGELDEKLDREIGGLREETTRGFVELEPR